MDKNVKNRKILFISDLHSWAKDYETISLIRFDTMLNYHKDIRALRKRLASLPTDWDGKSSVLELKQADYHWKQMEWWAFYFEYLVYGRIRDIFEIPGQRYGNVVFDFKGSINWDIKASAIKTNNHQIILNDAAAIKQSIRDLGQHGIIVGLCDVEYNDINRSFQKWHTSLKGGLSKYELQRIARNATSRYRKTRAVLLEILFLVLAAEDLEHLGLYRQGRNSDGSPRRPKYMLDLSEEITDHLVKSKISFFET